MRRANLCILLLLATACAPPKPGPTLTPEGKRDLDAVLRSAVEAGEIPGVVAIVTGRDSVLYRAAHGVMDAAGEKPMRADAIFRIFSMTKPITSLGVMMLREEGLLDLDAPASRYLPELDDREVLVRIDPGDSRVITRPAIRPITIRDLLRHTSGFGYAFSSHELVELERLTGVEPRKAPLLHDPGARWTYGVSTAFLGSIIERVSGRSLPDFFQDRIFGPLGMTDTSFDLPPEDHPRLVATYRRNDGRLSGEAPPERYRPSIRGDGGLLSTADDYARFLQMIIGRGERGGVGIVRETTVAEMLRDQLEGFAVEEQPGAIPATSKPFPLGAGSDGFGLGFQISVGGDAGGRAPGSGSWAGIQNTHFWVDPRNEIGVVLLLQLLPFYDEKAIELLTSFERALYAQLP